MPVRVQHNNYIPDNELFDAHCSLRFLRRRLFFRREPREMCPQRGPFQPHGDIHCQSVLFFADAALDEG